MVYSIDEKAEQLRRVALFSQLSVAELKRLALSASYRTYKTDEVIFHKDDPGEDLHVIIDGLVKIALPSETGDEAVLVLLAPGEFFGELALFDREPRSASAIAIDPTTTTIVLRREDFLSFIVEHPQAAMAIFSVLSHRLRRADDIIGDAVFLDLPTRVSKKLVELAEAFGHRVAEGVEIDLRLRQQELASMVGASRESVNRALGLLEQRGAVRIGRRKITLLDR